MKFQEVVQSFTIYPKRETEWQEIDLKLAWNNLHSRPEKIDSLDRIYCY